MGGLLGRSQILGDRHDLCQCDECNNQSNGYAQELPSTSYHVEDGANKIKQSSRFDVSRFVKKKALLGGPLTGIYDIGLYWSGGEVG